MQIWVFAPLDRPFDYLVGDEGVSLGDVVEVPFGANTKKGVVWGKAAPSDAKLKLIQKRLNYTSMRPAMRQFVETMSEYTLAPIGQILPMAIRAKDAPKPKPNALQANSDFEGELTPKRQALFDELLNQGQVPLKNIQYSRAIIKGLVNIGAAQETLISDQKLNITKHTEVELSEAQMNAAQCILAAKKPVVLKGVTGSGKTEIYLETIAHMIEAGKQTLVLLPEIALTSKFLDRFEARFGFRPAHWHSAMTDGERRQIWHQVAENETAIVIGARSALFLPFAKLGMIVVDEEHDKGYKQEDGVIYHARDMAVLRGHIETAKVVLASATPSIETMVNAQTERYELVEIHERFGDAILPEMQAIDMRLAGLDAHHWLSPELISAIKQRMEQGEQSLLFLNRRGFAPLTLCRACGHQIACPNCDARLVLHRDHGLRCHQCDYRAPLPKICPECEAEDRLFPIGPGVERIEEEVREMIPNAKTCILSSDMTGLEGHLQAELKAIEAGEYDVIIGTQLVAKGHNFPHLTLVGVVDADIGLEGADLRSAEGSFQVLRQVAGRAGRFEKPGLALVQSYQPEHPILQAILNPEDARFYEEEIKRRKAVFAPPYSRYVGVIISSPDAHQAMDYARQLVANSDELISNGMQILGPVPAPIARIRGRARMRILIKMQKSLPLHKEIKAWITSVKKPSKLRVHIDIDPQSFL